MKKELFDEVNALKESVLASEAAIANIRASVSGEHYEIFAGCLQNYISQMEKAQKEIYAEAKRINEHSERMMKAIERAIGHIKDFHD